MAKATEAEMLLRSILGVIGAASLASGCAGRSVSDGTTDDGAEADSTSESESESESESDGGDGDGDGDGDPILDVASETDTGESECGPFAEAWTLTVDVPPDCEPDFDQTQLVCFFPAGDSACDEAGYTEACILEGYGCGFTEVGEAIKCGPLISDEGACCYVVVGECLVGRPFSVHGRARVAELEVGLGWSDAPRPRLDDLDPRTRAALADAWSQHGASEHASIASFARFTSQLIALGAPARLISASLRAGLDERDHAMRCFGLARAYAGGPSRPGALAVDGCLADADPIEIATSLASEGCVAETVSLMLLTAAHARARDEAVRACLAEMIVDERRHVLLAWEALAWLCERFGQAVREAVARVFAQAEQHVGFGARTQLDADPDQLRAHGYLSIDERREVAIEALAEIVVPAAYSMSSQCGAGPNEAGGSINSGNACVLASSR